jgi:hypothetical protein
MPVYQPFNVYREQLSSPYLGLALWDPAPMSSIYDRVSVGDVGFVRTGAFLRMFNAMLPYDHPSNRVFELEHYVPLGYGPSVNIVQSTLAKGNYPSRRVFMEENAHNPQAVTPSE